MIQVIETPKSSTLIEALSSSNCTRTPSERVESRQSAQAALAVEEYNNSFLPPYMRREFSKVRKPKYKTTVVDNRALWRQKMIGLGFL